MKRIKKIYLPLFMMCGMSIFTAKALDKAYIVTGSKVTEINLNRVGDITINSPQKITIMTTDGSPVEYSDEKKLELIFKKQSDSGVEIVNQDNSNIIVSNGMIKWPENETLYVYDAEGKIISKLTGGEYLLSSLGRGIFIAVCKGEILKFSN